MLLTCLAGVLVWKAEFPGVWLYLVAALAPYGLRSIRDRAEPGAFSGLCFFALFWAVLKCVVDAVFAFATHWPDASAAFVALGPAPAQAALLCIRIFSLMALALALTLYLSPGRLALAVGWFIRPLAGKNAWKPALAFALMAHYLPRIHRMIRQCRTAALTRGLPSKGLAFWKIAFPHLFRLLGQSTWNQAVAIVCRGLDAQEAWVMNRPLPLCALAAMALGAGLFILPVL
ncbi:hypothetical protein LJC46_07270 [Desulfovibrio sp. OttesenSCG-928-G15]|nr:hypothetical protein [Desulfovibrio sp. OttesenSCG-928-G15]